MKHLGKLPKWFALGTAVKAIPPGGIPPFLEEQEQEYWCWAAVSVGVARFYDPTSSWTQCELVSQELNKKTSTGQSACCVDAKKAKDTTECNQVWDLDKALKRVGHYDSMKSASQTTYKDIEQAMTAGRPVAARVAFSKWNWGGHFILFRRCSKDYGQTPHYLWVEDSYSSHNASICEFEELKTYKKGSSNPGGYLNDGKWTLTYFTKP